LNIGYVLLDFPNEIFLIEFCNVTELFVTLQLVLRKTCPREEKDLKIFPID
jgi:hypothetical protein